MTNIANTPAFPNDDLGSLLELDPNSVYTPVAALCERLGLVLNPQLRRIRAHPLLAAALRLMAVEDDFGLVSKQYCLRIDLLPLWLAGLDARALAAEFQPIVISMQREMASLLWQSFKPQGFASDDTLLPDRYQQTPAESAYVGVVAEANLARQQMLLERQMQADRSAREEGRPTAPLDPSTLTLAQTVRRVAHTVAERSRRNEYPGIFEGLYRQWGLTSYRRMPPARLREALEWLERWYGDAIGEPEPAPDI